MKTFVDNRATISALSSRFVYSLLFAFSISVPINRYATCIPKENILTFFIQKLLTFRIRKLVHTIVFMCKRFPFTIGTSVLYRSKLNIYGKINFNSCFINAINTGLGRASYFARGKSGIVLLELMGNKVRIRKIDVANTLCIPIETQRRDMTLTDPCEDKLTTI